MNFHLVRGFTMRYFIYLAYDGTNYHGWQIQPNGDSVQETLMRAFSTFLRQEIEVVGAGRTDAGVHARLMVAHFDYDQELDCVQITEKLNRLLPSDIAVYDVKRVKDDAHARFDATYRTYKYYVTIRKDPFNRHYAWRLFNSLDFEKMNEAARVLFDYTDFTSFSKLHTDVKTNNCRIMYAEWTRVSGTEWVFTIKADRFLRNMVRAVVGTLDYLNAYAKPENRVDVNKPFSPSKMTRAEAREAYPEWYERVVVNGEKGRKKWDIAGKVHGDDPYALYHWWLRQIGEIKGGHRYFFLMCLAIYAYKCGVSKQQLRQDMKLAFEDLQMVKHENALTEDDIRSALEAYDKEYYNFTIADIEALTDIRIERNRRNGRTQKLHMQYMNMNRQFKVGIGECTNGGRPSGSGTAQQMVYEWRQQHPEGTKSQCKKDTGLTYPTIRKWWDTVPDGHITVKIRPSQALSDLLVEDFKKGL